MFKFIGMLVGAGIILLFGTTWLDAPEAKKVSAQLDNELNQVRAQIVPSSVTIDEKTLDTEVLSKTKQEFTDTSTTVEEKETENKIDENSLPPVVEETDLPWHIFWKPFVSQQSAEGFSSRLTKQTGININVVTGENGKHMVNFSYMDEADKQRILQLIQEKTGLQVTTL